MAKKPKLEIGKRIRFRLNDSPIGTEFCGEVLDITKDRRWVRILRYDGRETWYGRDKLTIVGFAKKGTFDVGREQRKKLCIKQICGHRYRHPSDKQIFCDKFCFRISAETEVPSYCDIIRGGKR